jgi:hypothetical protein
MASPIKLNVVVADAELLATVIHQVQYTNPDIEVVINAPSSTSQPVSQPVTTAGTGRFKIIRGL